ncbi:CDP-diacylglycerol--glycerol-3-phosphate 3-phosphatidyltransferase, partial [bacterium]|nr:CDP-diacylglycerol--glycerol-3-phosphate 3-phosphatidyltransferase [bacterium]
MNLPNKLTVGRIGLAAVMVVALLWPADGWGGIGLPWSKTIALAVFLLASFTDWWDGWLARRRGQETAFGTLLDPLADKVLVAAAFICFIDQPNARGHALVPAWMVLLVVSREFLVTGLRLVAREQGQVLQAERLGKHKTLSQMVTIIVVLAGLAARQDWGCLGWDCSGFDRAFSRVVLAMMAVTVVLTVWSGLA